MSSLTIRLDTETDSLLSSLAEQLHQSKSALARQGIIAYLEQQQQKVLKKQSLEESFSLSSIDQVQNRLEQSEASVRLSDDEYEQEMTDFFARELGLVR